MMDQLYRARLEQGLAVAAALRVSLPVREASGLILKPYSCTPWPATGLKVAQVVGAAPGREQMEVVAVAAPLHLVEMAETVATARATTRTGEEVAAEEE